MATTHKSTTKKTSTKKSAKTPVRLGVADWGIGTSFYDKNRDYHRMAWVYKSGEIDWEDDKNTIPGKVVFKILQESRKRADESDRHAKEVIKNKERQTKWFVERGIPEHISRAYVEYLFEYPPLDRDKMNINTFIVGGFWKDYPKKTRQRK